MVAGSGVDVVFGIDVSVGGSVGEGVDVGGDVDAGGSTLEAGSSDRSAPKCVQAASKITIAIIAGVNCFFIVNLVPLSLRNVG